MLLIKTDEYEKYNFRRIKNIALVLENLVGGWPLRSILLLF